MAGTADMIQSPRYCGHCGMYHGPVCPNIRRIEYWPDGSIKSVEYHQPPAQFVQNKT